MKERDAENKIKIKTAGIQQTDTDQWDSERRDSLFAGGRHSEIPRRVLPAGAMGQGGGGEGLHGRGNSINTGMQMGPCTAQLVNQEGTCQTRVRGKQQVMRLALTGAV